MAIANSANSRPVNAVPPNVHPIATSTPARPTIPLPKNAKTGLNTPGLTPNQRPGQVGSAAPKAFSNAPKPIAPMQPPQVNFNQQIARPAQPAPKPLTSGPAPHPPLAAQPTALLPPAPQQQHTTGAKSLKDISHDSYPLNSDDDAFFASLDLDEVEMRLIDETEADIGRPIEVDEGVGGAIDFDEGKRGPHEETAEATSSVEAKTLSDPVSSSNAGQQRQQQNTLALKPNHNHVRFEALKNALQEMEEQSPQQQQAPALQQKPSNAGINNGAAPQSVKSTSGSTTIGVARTPSIGGFQFPSGAVSLSFLAFLRNLLTQMLYSRTQQACLP